MVFDDPFIRDWFSRLCESDTAEQCQSLNLIIHFFSLNKLRRTRPVDVTALGALLSITITRCGHVSFLVYPRSCYSGSELILVVPSEICWDVPFSSPDFCVFHTLSVWRFWWFKAPGCLPTSYFWAWCCPPKLPLLHLTHPCSAPLFTPFSSRPLSLDLLYLNREDREG